jgi:hypothetical protein
MWEIIIIAQGRGTCRCNKWLIYKKIGTFIIIYNQVKRYANNIRFFLNKYFQCSFAVRRLFLNINNYINAKKVLHKKGVFYPKQRLKHKRILLVLISI